MLNGQEADFGRLLRQHRLAAGFSQEVLAERARMSVNGVGLLERGERRSPQRETLASLADALALTADQRREFEAVAGRPGTARHSPGSSVAVVPWASVAASNLPFSLTTFVGREKDVERVTALVRDHRLVTLTGAGGVGKTQTALHVANVVGGALESDVCFVGLAPLADGSLVVPAIAAALGIQEVPNRAQIETLLVYLKAKALLLVIDNCEHVIDAAASAANALITRCPRVRVLATSREPLRASGERAYRLPSLEVPEPGSDVKAKAAAAYSAIKLFIDRACAADQRFVLSDDNAPGVAELCRRLDGLPLAIELAAARTNAFSVSELTENLGDRFSILVGSDRIAPHRQQTMEAAIDWSYGLLSPKEQRVFERLAIFSGGSTLASTVNVCAGGDVTEGDVPRLLSLLVDKSLVLADIAGRETRFKLLESSREYAAKKLTACGEGTAVAGRHALACLELAERLFVAYESEPDLAWIELVHADLNNWRVALRWALIDRGNVVCGQQLVGALCNVWKLMPLEGRYWIGAARAFIDEHTPPPVLARISYAEACIAGNLQEPTAQSARGAEAMQIYRDLDDGKGLALSMGVLGRGLVFLGEIDAGEGFLFEALALARRLGMPKQTAYILKVLGNASNLKSDFVHARRYIEEAVDICRAIGADRVAGLGSLDLAEIELHKGDAEAAFQLALEAVATMRAFNDLQQLAAALNIVTACLIALQKYEEAELRARESLSARELQLTVNGLYALQRLSAIASMRPRQASDALHEAYGRAAEVLGFVDAQLTARGSPRMLYERDEYTKAVDALRKAMGDELLSNAMAAGAALSEQEAIQKALAIDRPMQE